VSSLLLVCSLRHTAVLTSKATPSLLTRGCTKLEFVYVFVRVSACLPVSFCLYVCVGAQPAVDTKQRSSSAMEEGTSAVTPGAATHRCHFCSAHTKAFQELNKPNPHQVESENLVIEEEGAEEFGGRETREGIVREFNGLEQHPTSGTGKGEGHAQAGNAGNVEDSGTLRVFGSARAGDYEPHLLENNNMSWTKVILADCMKS